MRMSTELLELVKEEMEVQGKLLAWCLARSKSQIILTVLLLLADLTHGT